nr:MAG TPA: hypothetical protein [Caudoviricetes sp.]
MRLSSFAYCASAASNSSVFVFGLGTPLIVSQQESR